MKLNTKFIILFIGLFLPTVTFADVSCDILSKGNNYYLTKKYNKAISTFKLIEDIDKIGKQPCTDSIYATMGTIYKILGNNKLKSNSYKAAIYYKTAANYNRAFAYATLCSNANICKDSKAFWGVR